MKPISMKPIKSVILDGKKLASLSEEEIRNEVKELLLNGIKPTLATILVGNDSASETYVRMKRNTCKIDSCHVIR